MRTGACPNSSAPWHSSLVMAGGLAFNAAFLFTTALGSVSSFGQARLS